MKIMQMCRVCTPVIGSSAPSNSLQVPLSPSTKWAAPLVLCQSYFLVIELDAQGQF